MRFLMLRLLVLLTTALELVWLPFELLGKRVGALLRSLSDWAEVEYLLAGMRRKVGRKS
jgi:uncharacterized protein involved in cysteine biosynthesis